MAYQALYRAYRPDSFRDILGQEPITLTLKRQIETGRVAHAYLFSGSRGTGKTTTAKVFARAINCEHPVDGNPCGECEACRALSHENNMDIIEIDAASNNGVDEIRDLREKVKYPPSAGKYKVYIIDEVHMLSSGAFNALLKTLEEPPSHAVFILATTEPQKLPATILSRCQRFDFHRISMDVLVERMMTVLGGVGRSATDEALTEIARAAEGGMRDALSILDMCLASAEGELEAEDVRMALGTSGRGYQFDMAERLIAGDAAGALRMIEQAMSEGRDPAILCRDMTAHFRNLMFARVIDDGLAAMLEATEEDAARYRQQAQALPEAGNLRLIDLFMKGEADMKWASRPRTVLELCAVRACRPQEESGAEAMEERIGKLEEAVKNGVVAAAPAPNASAQRQAPAPKPAAAAQPAANRAAPQKLPGNEAYAKAVAAVAGGNPALKSPLASMRFGGFEGGVLTGLFEKKRMMHMKLLERKQDVLEAAFAEAFGEPVKLLLRLEGDASAAPGKASSTARRTMEQAFDVFGRDVVEISDD
ncbi:MAG: DNA polymerase III subunit gamma/tau [Clostridia bacterium]|nr:DNA polymerase III subunit gamma/tau [Clostridia bacterium]